MITPLVASVLSIITRNFSDNSLWQLWKCCCHMQMRMRGTHQKKTMKSGQEVPRIASTYEIEKKKTKRLFRWFTSRGNVEKASKSERSNFLPVTWSGWDGSLCLCGCRDKISRGLRFCHAVSGFEVGIFPKTKAEKSADGLIVCWPIAKYPEFVNILRQTLHAY